MSDSFTLLVWGFSSSYNAGAYEQVRSERRGNPHRPRLRVARHGGQGHAAATQYPFNHYAERTFLTHCSALADFSIQERGIQEILHANDFVKTSPFSVDLPTWCTWHDHIDKHLMHLTIGRITNTTPWNGAPNKDY